MSFLRPNYDRPGKGVEKDEPELSGAAKFFTIFFRRLSKFAQLNLTFMIPVVGVLLLMLVVYIMPVQRYSLEITMASNIVKLSLWELYAVPLPLILLAPFHTGVMVVTKRLANEEYAFVWSEYWKGVKDNWKQGLLNGILCYLAYLILSFSIIYYYNQLTAQWFNFIPLALVLLLLIVFVLAELYIPLMIVSVDLKFTHIVKNSIIFGIMSLFKNLLTIIILAAVLVVMFFMQTMGLTIILCGIFVATLFFSFTAYVVTFFGYPMIRDYVIKPFDRKEEASNAIEVQKDTSNYEYQNDELDDDDSLEYVYYNGRLVKKDEIEKHQDK